jgi:hypothetical protein
MARAVDMATLDDDTIRESLEYIAANLRGADRAELQATNADEPDPFWRLIESWDASVASWLIVDGSGLPIGLFGVAAHTVPNLGVAWMMGTDGLEREALSVARQTRQYVEELHRFFPVLWANVDARNKLSMKWLEWAGFSIHDAHPNFGPERRLFYQFLRTI